VREFSRPAYQLAMMLVNDQETAHDIVQEAFVRLWRSPRAPRERQAFKSWLLRTVTNLAHDHYRQQVRWRRLQFGMPRPADNPEEEADRRRSNSVLAAALRTLSRREQEAIYLRFFEGMPYEGLGEVQGKTSVASRVLVHRALRKLRVYLGQDARIGDAQS
jgi:RNA polymerase sigma-70 factor (ECF subfamily)